MWPRFCQVPSTVAATDNSYSIISYVHIFRLFFSCPWSQPLSCITHMFICSSFCLCLEMLHLINVCLCCNRWWQIHSATKLCETYKTHMMCCNDGPPIYFIGSSPLPSQPTAGVKSSSMSTLVGLLRVSRAVLCPHWLAYCGCQEQFYVHTGWPTAGVKSSSMSTLVGLLRVSRAVLCPHWLAYCGCQEQFYVHTGWPTAGVKSSSRSTLVAFWKKGLALDHFFAYYLEKVVIYYLLSGRNYK